MQRSEMSIVEWSKYMGGERARNKACILLDRRGESIRHWRGLCFRLAEMVADRHRGTLLVVEPTVGLGLPVPQAAGGGWWSHHVAPVVAGLVHDAWFPALVLPPADYCAQAFPVPGVQRHGFDTEDIFEAWAVATRANERARQLWQEHVERFGHDGNPQPCGGGTP